MEEPAPTFWYFTIVASGIEHIRVIRKGSIHYDGVMPAPFGMHLTVGDAVHFKMGRGQWRCKFKIVEYKGHPRIKFGTSYGPHPGQYRSLNPDYIDGRRLRNAGLLARSKVRKS